MDTFERKMEPLNSCSLGAMGSLLKKLDELLRTEERAQGLIGDLRVISTKMEKLSEVHSPPRTVKYWMIDARELSYDMEVCVDRFVHANQPEDLPAKLAWIFTWTKEILGFAARVKEVNERCERYNLVPSSPTKIIARHQLQTLYEEPDPVGIEEPTNKLLEWLMPKNHGEDEDKLNVVSVLGDGGVGKSTLVKRLWRASEDSKFQFNCRAFVKTAKKPDTRMILRSILSQVHPQEPPKCSSKVPNLIHDLREHLRDKRYFIVIDDLWDISVWNIVRRAFPERKCRIITTTAVENVARSCCSYDRNNIVNVCRLHDGEAKKVFIDRAFGSQTVCPSQFNDVTHKITRKCGGLPLAIICTARLVANQPETEQGQQLDYVNNSLPNNLRTQSSSTEILAEVLNLCYSRLPCSLRTCLLYLSVYPENYLFLKEDLVKQWIAEDFICTPKGKDTTADVAGSYFDELVNLGLIQRMDIIDSNKKRLFSYTVHPVAFDFITSKSMEDNFFTIIDYSESTIVLTEKIRRLSLHFGSATYATIPASVELSQVRSLVFIGLLNCMPSIAEFKLVRVMILHIHSDDGDTSFSLAEICKLVQLRFLQVRCNISVQLPAEMLCLKQLETLEIYATIERIPSDIVHISSLSNVCLGGKTNHKHLSWDSVDTRNSAPSPPVQIFELLAFCYLPRLPEWIEHLHKLSILEIVVTELPNADIFPLSKLPLLRVLSLYVRKATAENIMFNSGDFPVLEYFKFICDDVMLLVFLKEAMRNLQRLKFSFNAYRGRTYGHMLVGIENLLNLKEIAGRIGAAPDAQESDKQTAESAFIASIREYIQQHGSFKVKRVDRVGKDYYPLVKQNSNVKNSSSEHDEVPEKENWMQCDGDFTTSELRNLQKVPGDEVLKKEHQLQSDADFTTSELRNLQKMPEEDTDKITDWMSKPLDSAEDHDATLQKSVVGQSNITFPSFEIVVDGTSEENKVGSGRYEEVYKDADQVGKDCTGELIREIGQDLSILCLRRLSRSYYHNVACVNRSFRTLVRSGELYRSRREAGIVEQMIYCSCNVLDWEGFDPCRQRWFSIPSMPPIECLISDKDSLAVGTNILVFGKREEAHVVLRYSLLTNSWTTGEMMNTPRCLFGSASFGEKAIVAGGIGENGALSSAELYDSEMKTWTTLPSMIRARNMCSGFFMDGKFYVIGGKTERHKEVLSCAEEFDLENGTWRLIPDMAQGLNGGSGAPPLVAVVNNELYAADYATKEVRKYDKENNAWITLGLLPGRYTSVHGWGIAFRSCGDMLIVIGAMSVGGGGVIEICSWVPNNKPPDWKIIGTRRSGSFVYNCAVMSC